MTAWTEERKAAKREYNRAYYAKNREAVLAQVRRYREANTDRLYQAEVERRYGLDRGELGRMLAEQDHRCRICREPETYSRRGYRHTRLSVDHDHETGRVRGLLCMDCNRALGLFDDDPERLEAAARYLRERP